MVIETPVALSVETILATTATRAVPIDWARLRRVVEVGVWIVEKKRCCLLCETLELPFFLFVVALGLDVVDDLTPMDRPEVAVASDESSVGLMHEADVLDVPIVASFHVGGQESPVFIVAA